MKRQRSLVRVAQIIFDLVRVHRGFASGRTIRKRSQENVRYVMIDALVSSLGLKLSHSH